MITVPMISRNIPVPSVHVQYTDHLIGLLVSVFIITADEFFNSHILLSEYRDDRR